MGYADYIKDLLRPLRVYDLDSGAGAGEIETLGEAMDGVCTALSDAEREGAAPTATGKGLSAWESALPFYPCCMTLADRRRAIMSLMRMDGASFTPSEVNATLAGCGIAAVAEETDEHYAVRVSFPQNRGVPPDLESLKERVEAILPCHLTVEYLIILITWAELIGFFPTWGDLAEMDFTWDALERYAGEEE